MLSDDESRALTRVGAGTPMGELLRRYWWPIAAVSELDGPDGRAASSALGALKPVRLLGEDLVLYRDGGGTLGLLERRCPHRGASLGLGMVEARGLRCSYHGWRFDERGACVEQPFEDVARPGSSFRGKVRARAYRTGVAGGLVWAYLGPEPAPCLWDWQRFHDRGWKVITLARLPVNWLQCQENAIDPLHFEWLHGNFDRRRHGRPGAAPTHVALAFDEFEHGFVYRRELAGQGPTEQWHIGRVCLWPNALYVGDFMWSVPVDDDHTLHITWSLRDVPGTAPVEQAHIPFWVAPVFDARSCEPLTARTGDQDFATWIGQGRLVDRTQEHLGESDRGVILMRRRFASDLAVVAAGGDPKNVLRDPAANVRLPLPRIERPPRRGEPGISGEPPHIARAYDEAWVRHGGARLAARGGLTGLGLEARVRGWIERLRRAAAARTRR
ncbi:MAG: Rieske 2Fe-2S domain-containing protein [Myxococcota bacterium]